LEDAPPELLGLDPVSGKAPETRIRDGLSARTLVQLSIRDDQLRARQRALVNGLIDGNPPYSERRRREAGLGWTSNLNFMEGESILSTACTPYYALYNGVQNYATFRTAYQPDNPEFENWNDEVSQKLHDLFKRWSSFDYEMQRHQYEMLKHGPGPVWFDDDSEWRFRSISSGNVLPPKRAACVLDHRLRYLSVRVTYGAVELWEKIKDEGAAKDRGWNVEAVKMAIKSASRGVVGLANWRLSPWEMWQQKLKDNDLFFSSTDCDEIMCAHLYVREFDGKVSHFVVTETEMPAEQGQSIDNEFLFKDTNCYDDYEQAVIVFFQNIGDGTWHSVRGLATKAFKHLEVSNRLKNRMIDGAFIESSLVLQPGSAKGVEKMQLMQVGPVTIVPAGVEIKQTKLAGFLDGPMTVDRLLGNHLANNIGNFNQRTLSREDGKGEMPTATQIQQQVAKEANLSQGQIMLYYLTLDKLYAEMFRRAVKSSDPEAMRFREECEAAGVPPEALLEVEYVRANRASGYGSPQMRILTDQQLAPYVPMFPEDGKQNWLEDLVSAIKGPDKVRRYLPKQAVPTVDDWMANQENAAIHEGVSPILTSGQDDEKHLNIHFGDASKTLAPLQQQMQQGQPPDPSALQSAIQYVQVMGPHVQAHLQRISADPMRKTQAEYFKQAFKQLVEFNGKLRGAMDDAQQQANVQAQQQSQATALSALDQARVQQVQTQTQMKAQETQARIQDKKVKTLNDIKLQQIKAAEEMRQGRAKEAAQPVMANS
jgi:hypothetical protein